jgi:septum formation protein
MQHLPFNHPPVYLASRSPRRQELLRAAGIPFTLVDIDIDESFPPDMVVEDVPEFIARKKAEAVLPDIPADAVVICADSVVLHNSRVYGKPASRDEAVQMLEELSGHRHTVITGVFIGDHARAVSFADYTSVWMDRLHRDEIDYYIDHYRPFDKAGAYGIQEWVGWTRINRIEGSYANVMGLPVHRVYETLRRWQHMP